MNKRIIVIDDDPDIKNDYTAILKAKQKNEDLDLISDFLSIGDDNPKKDVEHKIDFDLDTASQGKEGYEKVKLALDNEKPYAVAFIDMRMPPGWNGLKTAKQIREIDKDIEIVIVTAFADVPRSEIVEQIGCPNKILYLKKPFASEEIEQLALNLTSKYDLMKKNQTYTRSLKKLIKNLRTIKGNIYTNYEHILKNILNHILDYVGSQKGIIALVEKQRLDKIIEIGGLSNHDLTEINNVIERIEHEIDLKMYYLEKNFIIFPLYVPDKPQQEIFIFALDAQESIRQNEDIIAILTETAQDLFKNFILQKKFIDNEKLASIGMGADKIIHDLKSPLSIISGYMQLIQSKINSMENNKDVKENIKDSISKVMNVENFMLSSIKGILEYSKGKTKLVMNNLNSKILMESFRKNIETYIEKEKISLHISDFEDFNIVLDFERIKAVFSNLLSFSLELFEKSKIRIHEISIKLENESDFFTINFVCKSKEKYEDLKINLVKNKTDDLSYIIIEYLVKLHDGKLEMTANDSSFTCSIKLPSR